MRPCPRLFGTEPCPLPTARKEGPMNTFDAHRYFACLTVVCFALTVISGLVMTNEH